MGQQYSHVQRDTHFCSTQTPMIPTSTQSAMTLCCSFFVQSLSPVQILHCKHDDLEAIKASKKVQDLMITLQATLESRNGLINLEVPPCITESYFTNILQGIQEEESRRNMLGSTLGTLLHLHSVNQSSGETIKNDEITASLTRMKQTYTTDPSTTPRGNS